MEGPLGGATGRTGSGHHLVTRHRWRVPWGVLPVGLITATTEVENRRWRAPWEAMPEPEKRSHRCTKGKTYGGALCSKDSALALHPQPGGHIQGSRLELSRRDPRSGGRARSHPPE
jgi:hypothetical protein